MALESLSDPGWQHTPGNEAIIAGLEASSEAIDRVFAEAYRERCFVVEVFVAEGYEFTGVGELDAITRAEQELGIKLDISEFGIGECMVLGAFSGKGTDRVGRVRDGLRQVLEARRT